MMKQFDVNIFIFFLEEYSDKVKVIGFLNNVKNVIEVLQKKCEQFEFEKEERVFIYRCYIFVYFY